MARKKVPEDLSLDELRRLLVDKRRGARRERLEHYRRTGRVVNVAPDLTLDASHPSAPVVDTREQAESTSEPAPAPPPPKIHGPCTCGH